jgi:hypothetical protein
MRTHLFAAAGLSALLLAAGGCSGDDSPTSAAPAPAGATPAVAETASAAAGDPAADPAATSGGDAAEAGGAAGDAALSADTEAICDQAARTATSFGKTFTEDYKLLIEASAQGGQAKTSAEQKAARDVQNFSFALTDMSKLAADKGVKKALASMGEEVTALKGDLDKLDDKKMAALHATLDKACGRD